MNVGLANISLTFVSKVARSLRSASSLSLSNLESFQCFHSEWPNLYKDEMIVRFHLDVSQLIFFVSRIFDTMIFLCYSPLLGDESSDKIIPTDIGLACNDVLNGMCSIGWRYMCSVC